MATNLTITQYSLCLFRRYPGRWLAGRLRTLRIPSTVRGRLGREHRSPTASLHRRGLGNLRRAVFVFQSLCASHRLTECGSLLLAPVRFLVVERCTRISLAFGHLTLFTRCPLTF